MRSRWLNVQIVGQARLVGTLVALLFITAACGIAHPTELNFRTDKRLTFIAPPARALVRTPLHVAWRMEGFRVARPGSAPPSENSGYFAVFVDRAPIRPRGTMRDIAHNDLECLRRPDCPDASYLAGRGIYQTTDSQLTIEQIPPIAGDTERIQFHTITVVLMDTSGHRIGESAWGLEVRMRKPGL
jgi:hypothetical protein